MMRLARPMGEWSVKSSIREALAWEGGTQRTLAGFIPQAPAIARYIPPCGILPNAPRPATTAAPQYPLVRRQLPFAAFIAALKSSLPS